MEFLSYVYRVYCCYLCRSLIAVLSIKILLMEPRETAYLGPGDCLSLSIGVPGPGGGSSPWDSLVGQPHPMMGLWGCPWVGQPRTHKREGDSIGVPLSEPPPGPGTPIERGASPTHPLRYSLSECLTL